MQKFQVRHLLLATASLCAFFAWMSLNKTWIDFRTRVGIDGEIVQTENGPVTRLFYSKRYAGTDAVKVDPPLLTRTSAYWVVGASFILATVGIWVLDVRKDSPLGLCLKVIQVMALAIVLYELPNLLEFMLDLIASLAGNIVVR